VLVSRKVYIDTAELESLIHQKRKGEGIRIFNVTMYLSEQDGDPIMHHKEKHIPESEYLDLRYLRDMAAKYPNTFPSEKYFTDVMK
jgi:3-mercaptopyruvate sulfurtransferase SseA